MWRIHFGAFLLCSEIVSPQFSHPFVLQPVQTENICQCIQLSQCIPIACWPCRSFSGHILGNFIIILLAASLSPGPGQHWRVWCRCVRSPAQKRIWWPARSSWRPAWSEVLELSGSLISKPVWYRPGCITHSWTGFLAFHHQRYPSECNTCSMHYRKQNQDSYRLVFQLNNPFLFKKFSGQRMGLSLAKNRPLS